jgi:hypothetical protein
MTKERYEFLSSAEDEAESELCSFIQRFLEDAEQVATKNYNETKNMAFYYDAKACRRAIHYLDDIKDSL